ncbi:hypothetical protein [Lysinibacillus xylanilyticus]|uniref:hypothetical protein n=1 Tax=Lysinibacillus xylanilyticus TaxID=582475 RepID=UPI003D02A98C
MPYNEIKFIGFIAMLIFGGIFVLRWLYRDELLLDQLIGFVIGPILFIMPFYIKILKETKNRLLYLGLIIF